VALALRAIGFAGVRSGILSSQSGFRRSDEQIQSFPKAPVTRADIAE
jgi:hypothetical protein